jgi:histidine ammonia-lyase
MPVEHARAVVVTKLLQLMNGRSGTRLQVAEFLSALLNSGKPPALSWEREDGAVLAQLAAACYSEEAAAAAGVEAPKLSPMERTVMQGGAAASAGTGALVALAARRLLSMAQAACVLSMEATGMQVCVRRLSAGSFPD